jgi:hypothetical protein
MGDTSFPSFCILSKGNINYIMKDMKIWRVVFVMLATLILVSCSSDDEDYQIDQLAGTWLQVYDEGVVAEGYVKYTFTPGVPSTSGSCTIHVSDVFAGDTTIQRSYVISDDNRRLLIFEELYGGSPETQKYDIQRISAKGMTWRPVGSDVVMNFRKVE